MKLERNNDDFIGFLKWLEYEGYNAKEIIAIVEKPYKWQHEYGQYHNWLRIKAGECEKLTDGRVSDCCDYEVHYKKSRNSDYICGACYADCEPEDMDFDGRFYYNHF